MFKNYKSKLYNIKGGAVPNLVDLKLDAIGDGTVSVKITPASEQPVSEQAVMSDQMQERIRACLLKIRQKYAKAREEGDEGDGGDDGDGGDESEPGADEGSKKNPAPGAGANPGSQPPAPAPDVLQPSVPGAGAGSQPPPSPAPAPESHPSQMGQSSSVPERLFGFSNNKYKCYFNAILQLLYTNEQFVTDILSHEGRNDDVYYNMQQLFNKLKTKTNDGSQALQEAIAFEFFGRQIGHEDALEVLNLLVGSNMNFAEIYHDHFSYIDEHTAICTNPQYTGDSIYQIKPFLVLQISDSDTVQNLINQYKNQFNPTKDYRLPSAVKCQHLIERKVFKFINNYLIIQLRRTADKDLNASRLRRFNVVVDNIITIDGIRLTLAGIIIHEGEGIDGGHYVFINKINGHTYNDATVTKENLYNNERIINSNAFVLLYKRETVTAISENVKRIFLNLGKIEGNKKIDHKIIKHLFDADADQASADVADLIASSHQSTATAAASGSRPTATAASVATEFESAEPTDATGTKYIKYNDKYLKYKTKYLALKEKILNH